MKRHTSKELHLSEEAVRNAVNNAIKQANKGDAGHWNTWSDEAKVLIALANDRKNLLKRIDELERLVRDVA